MLHALNNTFGRLAEETSCAIILVHHAGKGGVENGARGASSIKGWCDSMQVGEEVENDDDGKVIKMHYVKSRNFERRPAEWYMRMTNSLDFELLEDYEPPISEGPTKKYADATDVMNLVMGKGEVKGRGKLVDMVAERGGCSKASAKKAIDKAVETGLVKEEKSDKHMGATRYTA